MIVLLCNVFNLSSSACNVPRCNLLGDKTMHMMVINDIFIMARWTEDARAYSGHWRPDAGYQLNGQREACKTECQVLYKHPLFLL